MLTESIEVAVQLTVDALYRYGNQYLFHTKAELFSGQTVACSRFDLPYYQLDDSSVDLLRSAGHHPVSKRARS